MEKNYVNIKVYNKDWKILNIRRKAGETFASVFNTILEEYKHMLSIEQKGEKECTIC